MSVREYIGARYIPVFADPIEWDNTLIYEPLTVVKHEGASYVSRKSVPAGIALDNTDYWILWADYNAQLQHYIDIVNTFDGRIDDIEDIIEDIEDKFPIDTTDIADDAITINKFNKDVYKEFIPNMITSMVGLWRIECNDLTYFNGGCRFEYNNVDYWAVAIGSDICIIDSTGNITTRYTDSAIGHGQTLSYVDDFLWVTTGTSFRRYTVTSNSVAYVDEITVPGYNTIFDATLDEENYYICDASMHVVNRQTGLTVISRSLTDVGVSNPGNGIFCWDFFNAICLNRFATNHIVMLDKNTLETIQTINIAAQYGYLNMFEPEFCYTDGSSIYIGVNNGYNAYTNLGNDIAPQTLMYTDILHQSGMPFDLSDIHANTVSNVKRLNIDYVNGAKLPLLPNNFIDAITVKYPQDAAALISATNDDTFYQLGVTSKCPIVLSFVNCNIDIRLEASVPGIRLVGGNYNISDGGGYLVNNKSNFLLGDTSIKYGVTCINSLLVATITQVGNLNNTTEKLLNAVYSSLLFSSSAQKSYCTLNRCSFVQFETQ